MKSYRVILRKLVFCTFHSAARAHCPQGRKFVFFIGFATQTTYFTIIATPHFVRQNPLLTGLSREENH
jgi:hypothetical protein